ncbi:MAG TPA: PKD domain-containing protein [Bacteroidales bacterium]|nr:PKD domain-containing protein [Bacteroidales bacterium]
MKKITIVVVLMFFACIYSRPVLGQLSDTLMIGPVLSDDFASFSDAVAALNSQGISGNVVFLVRPGTYTERISINQITGAGPAASVVFQPLNGDSTSVRLQFPSSSSSANNYVIQLNGADYITFDKLTIKRTDTLKYCKVIDFYGSARKNTFSNCIIEGNANSGNTQMNSAVICTNNSGFKAYTTFQNNIVKNGSYGLYFSGMSSTAPDSSILIRNNKFINQSLAGVQIVWHRYAYVEGNEVTTNTTNIYYTGMYFQNSNDTMRILNNKIILSMGDGLSLISCNETIIANVLIANNFISIGGNSNAHGIYIVNSKNLYILHNSINIHNTQAIQGACVHINGSNTANLFIKNNVFKNGLPGQGYTYYVAGTASTPIAQADYNALFINSGTFIAYWKTAGVTTLTNWRSLTSLDSNSFIANPGFISDTDLHAGSNLINGTGTATLTPFVIKYDIDGDLRNPTTPDIGADEFGVDDLGVCLIELPSSGGYCAGNAFNVRVHIKNYGLYPYTGEIAMFYQIGALPPVTDTVHAASIAPGDSLVFIFLNSDSLSTSGNYKFLAGTDLVEDNDHSNDTTSRMVEVTTFPVAGFTYLVNDLDINFTNTSTNASTYNWNFDDGNFSGDTNPVHTYAGDGSYTVTLHANNACGMDSFSENITVVGIYELSDKYGFSFYPNPVTEELKIILENNSINVRSVCIYSGAGNLIRKIGFEEQNNMSIDMSILPEAIYFISVQAGDKIFYQKVLKIK